MRQHIEKTATTWMGLNHRPPLSGGGPSTKLERALLDRTVCIALAVKSNSENMTHAKIFFVPEVYFWFRFCS